MHLFEVGQLYRPGRTIWPEVAQNNFRGGQHELVMFYSRPTADEIRTIRFGLAQFALYSGDGLIVLLFRFGDGEWSDAPYSWHRIFREEQSLPDMEIGPEQGAGLQIIPVDASTGINMDMRLVGLGHEFTLALHSAIREQAGQAWDPAAYGRDLDQLYRRYTGSKLAQIASVHYSSTSPKKDKARLSSGVPAEEPLIARSPGQNKKPQKPFSGVAHRFTTRGR